MTTCTQDVAGECVVFADRNGPMGQPIEDLVDRLAARRRKGRPLSVDWLDPAAVFGLQLDPAKEGYDYPAFVRQMVGARLTIVDMGLGEIAYYVLGVRHALSNGLTLAVSISAPGNAFPARPHSDKLGICLDVSHQGWIDTALKLTESLEEPRQAAWTNPLQRSEEFRVTRNEASYPEPGLAPGYWRFSDPAAPIDETQPKILIWQGGIQNAKDFSVWVNSENIYMEMARFWDKSVSAQIRRLGAVRNGALRGSDLHLKDTLGVALAEKMGTRLTVPIGTVLMTKTAQASPLWTDNRVSHVAHLAAVKPMSGKYGFIAGGEIRKCLTNVFLEMKKVQDKLKAGEAELFSSVLIPLVGSGDGGAHPSQVAHELVVNLRDIYDTAAAGKGARSRASAPELPARIGLIAYLPSHHDYLCRELRNCGFHHVEGEPPSSKAQA